MHMSAGGRLWSLSALLAALAAVPLPAQSAGDSTATAQPAQRRWYERLSLRGYSQLRYNRLLETNDLYTCSHCDRSLGRNQGFFLRRARVVLSGDVSDRVSIYFQPDFATDAGGSQHFAQIRDLYADVYLDAAKTTRLRIGQSKVPYGWETLQSSSNRLPFDRSEGINSGVPGEREVGLALYWTPSAVRRRFRILSDSGLKGTGDYGLVGVGLFNGQGANRSEANDRLEAVARISYPFRLASGQFIEVGVQGYDNEFIVPSSQRSPGVTGPTDLTDRRVAASFVFFPQPFGVQAEWNVGKGPDFERATRRVEEQDLRGGYLQAMYRARRGDHVITPFVRTQYYDGGWKSETDARHYVVREYEGGVEWLPMAALELTAAYVVGDRRTSDGAAAPENRQKGQLLRLQAQFNY